MMNARSMTAMRVWAEATAPMASTSAAASTTTTTARFFKLFASCTSVRKFSVRLARPRRPSPDSSGPWLASPPAAKARVSLSHSPSSAAYLPQKEAAAAPAAAATVDGASVEESIPAQVFFHDDPVPVLPLLQRRLVTPGAALRRLGNERRDAQVVAGLAGQGAVDGRADNPEIVRQAVAPVERVVLRVQHIDQVLGEVPSIARRVNDDGLPHRQRTAREAVARLPQAPAFVQIQQRLGLEFQHHVPDFSRQQPVAGAVQLAVSRERPVQIAPVPARAP